MALYANYVPNPSFELGTANWTAENGAAVSRVGSNAFSGSYSLRIQYSSSGDYGGTICTIPISPGAGQAHTLSLYISGATESHGSSYNSGIQVIVSDLLPGQTVGQRQELKSNVFSRTTSGRVALRNFVPRATADRIVVTVRTCSSYFQAEQRTVDNSGLVWATFGISGSGGITSPAGTNISAAQWNSYESSGYTVSGLSNFTYRDNFNQLSYAAKSGTWSKSTVTQPEIRGGTATVYIDGVQLEQGTTESAYVDGTKTGYVWAGSPHNSATLNVVQLEASGSGSLTSDSVEVRPVAFLQASGTGSLSGTAEITTEGTISASGSGSMSGSIEMWQYGPMSADGSGGLTGTAELYSILNISADGELMGPGTGIYEPRAELGIAWPTGADGFGELTGTIEMSFPQPISASGEGSLTGTAHLDIGLQLSASGSGSLSGTAALDDAIPKGAFGDFAIYGVATTDQDPLKIGRGASNAGTNSGANGAAWTRIYGEFFAPADQPSSSGYAWRRAAYAAVGFRFNGVPAANYQELTAVQLEPSTADNSPGPRTYSTAKTVTPIVHADRVNYASPEIGTFIGSTDILVTETDPSPIPHDPRPIRELKILSSDAEGFFVAQMVAPPPGTQCVLSVYLKGSTEVSTLRVEVLAQDFTNLGFTDVFLPVDSWLRVVVPFVAVDQDHMMAINLPTVGGYPASFYAAGLQVERGTYPTEFMGFQAGSREYYYRDNGTDDTEGVFWYRDIDERIPLVTTAVDEHLPLSMRASDPEFGLVPHLD